MPVTSPAMDNRLRFRERGALRSVYHSGLLDGIGFAWIVEFAWLTTYVVILFLTAAPSLGIVAALKKTGAFAFWSMTDTLPAVFLFVIIVNRTSAISIRRYLWLLAACALLWAWWDYVGWISARTSGPVAAFVMPMASPLHGLACIFLALLMFGAIAFRSSAHSASTALMQREFASSALDAEVKRARLQLLRAQIEPHFLFNTLATVRTLMRIDRAAAADMIDDLMRYLAEALPKLRQDESSLAEELRLIKSYLRIHQIRMGSRLTFELSVPEQLGAERIPSMMLLTLVENALKHGINPTVEGGSIHVSARRDTAALVLKVADSGAGMVATQGYGMGLANIRRRLTLLYGDDAELTLAAASAHGAVATVSIPLALVS